MRTRKEEEFPTLQQAHAGSSSSTTTTTPSSISGRDRAKSPTLRSESPAAAAGGLGKVLLGRRDSPTTTSSETTSSRNEPTSKTDHHHEQQPHTIKQTLDPLSNGGNLPPFREKSARLIDDQQQFCTSGLASVMTDNTDFLVVGVVGLQSTGKSTILNKLANYVKSNYHAANDEKGSRGASKGSGNSNETEALSTGVSKTAAADAKAEEIFREQTAEKQMLGEHCSSGVKAWVSPTTRTLFLDSHPFNSVSMLDRAMQIIDKKHNAEYGTMEATVEIQSLQVAGFLMSVCHVLILVQDHFVDSDLLQAIQTAEMLRPSSPALIGGGGGSADGEGSGGGGGQVVEYFPEFVLVHNKSPLDDFSANRKRLFQEFYKKTFALSQLKFNTGKVTCEDDDVIEDWSVNAAKTKWKMGQVNLCLLPEFEENEESCDEENWNSSSSSGRFYDKHFSFDDCAAKLRRKVTSVPPSNLTTAKLTEKLWLKFAEKTWDNIRNCPFYGEYSRLLNS